MAVVITEDFENGLTGWTLNGTPTTGAAAAHSGAAGLISNATGGGSYIQKVPVAGTRIWVIRAWVWIQTRPSVTQAILKCGNPNGIPQINASSTGALQAALGPTVVNSVVLNTGQWYRIDTRFDCSAATAVLDWQIDGVTQTQITRAQTPIDYTLFRVGLQGSSVGTVYVDDLTTADAAVDYPLGALASAPAGLSAGAGSAYVVAASLKPRAGAATGTGATFQGIEGILYTISGGSAATGSAALAAPVATVSAQAPAGAATGTAVASAPKVTLGSAAGNASGTGAAHTTTNTTVTAADAGYATGRAGIYVPLASDTFTRAAGSGLGTSSSGHVWTWATFQAFGGGGEMRTTGTEAEAYINDPGQQHGAALLSTSIRDTRVFCRWKVDKAPETDVIEVFAWARSAGVFDNGYGAHILIWPTVMTGNFQRRNNVGTRTPIPGAPQNLPGAPDLAYNEWWIILFECLGASPTELRMKVYRESDGEPSNWTFQATDSAGPQTAGSPGVSFRMDTGTTNPPFTFIFDDVSFEEINANNPTVTAGTNAAAVAASAIGAASPATITANTTVNTGLTIQMGMS